MKQVIATEKRLIKLWLDDIEASALAQAKNLANLPFVYKHIAIMPDAHLGYGMPIGGVMATKGVVIPYAVGVDIGCGVCAVKTSLTDIDTKTLKKIMGEIRKVIPIGFKKHRDMQDFNLIPKLPNTTVDYHSPYFKCGLVVTKEHSNALKSLGTLGGGNHFIEIQKDDDGYIWIMLHSGSRNLGHKVATHYNKLAIELNEKWHSSVPKEWELAFLPLDSNEGQAYLTEMNYCVDYAWANRELMMVRIVDLLNSMCVTYFGEPINIAHNYAAMENHSGQNVMVHRKGATRAYEDELGIIPGSQGTFSYIVSGKGNSDSFRSCSHGAGRLMGRKQAQRTLDLEVEQKRLDDMGVIHSIRYAKDLDEAPGAYKDINVVMDNQKDLVDIVTKLTPLAVIKG